METESAVVGGDLENLKFKRTFWIIFVLILIIQIYKIVLSAYFGFNFNSLPLNYYYLSQIGGVVWYFLLLAVIILDLRLINVPAYKIYNFDFQAVKKWAPKLIKYAGGCAAFVIVSSVLFSGSEFHLEDQNTLTISLTFLNAVILAPIIEEMAFRGYLYNAMFSVFKRKKERMVVNAMLFASAHVFLGLVFIGAGVPYYIFVLGYLLAGLYEESRSIVPGILLHAFNNGLVFLMSIIQVYYLK